MESENPYSAPQVSLEDDTFPGDESKIRRIENKLRVPSDAETPRRCVSCNRLAWHRMSAAIAQQTEHKKHISGWYVVAALFVVWMFLALAYYGIEISFELPWWLVPTFFLVCIILSTIIAYHKRRIHAFYLCAPHFALRTLHLVPIGIFWIALLAFQFWIHSPYNEDFPLSELLSIPYLISLVILMQVTAWIRTWFHMEISGSQIDEDVNEFKGFGKRYLNSFAEVDEQQRTEAEET